MSHSDLASSGGISSTRSERPITLPIVDIFLALAPPPHAASSVYIQAMEGLSVDTDEVAVGDARFLYASSGISDAFAKGLFANEFPEAYPGAILRLCGTLGAGIPSHGESE